MARITKRVAQKTDNFKKIDQQYAYAVWIIEKEFNVGPITEDFLAMKFWNILDEENTKRYARETNPKGSGKGVTTFG